MVEKKSMVEEVLDEHIGTLGEKARALEEEAERSRREAEYKEAYAKAHALDEAIPWSDLRGAIAWLAGAWGFVALVALSVSTWWKALIVLCMGGPLAALCVVLVPSIGNIRRVASAIKEALSAFDVARYRATYVDELRRKEIKHEVWKEYHHGPDEA